MTVYILGGGPAGMAVIDGLVDNGTNQFVLIERSPILGGLAQTVHWQGAGDHDLGPHKIFSLDKELVSRVEALLPSDDWLTREKVSTIYMKGHFLPYPPSPFSLAGVFGYGVFFRMVFGYGLARIKSIFSSQNTKTFEDDLVQRLGPDLYQVLFKPIALKLWGDPTNLDVKLSRGRVQTPSLIEVIARMLKIKESSDFEALTFRYPKNGLGRLWSAIRKKGEGHGEIHLNHTVTGIELNQGRVSQIRCLADGQEKTFEIGSEDFVVSTLPLGLTTNLFSKDLSQSVREKVDQVVALNDLFLVFLHVDVKSLVEESWVFIPDPDIVFHRLSEQESFDPGMSPSGSIVCCEIMSSESRPFSACTDSELVEKALKGLHDMGYKDFSVLNQRVIRLPKSYPVFKPGFEEGLKEVLQHFDSIENFRTVGRQGAFNYIGTLDAMDIGYGFVNWHAQRKEMEWDRERARTNHYPVLD